MTKDSDSNPSSSVMEKLLEQVDVHVPKAGDLVTGRVIDIGKNSIYLDLGILGTGIVMGREMKDGMGIADNLKKGDEVEASVLGLEDEDGYMELSLREAGYEKIWDELERKKKENEVIETKILAANRGGLMVEINGITGFLPVSQLSNENYPRVEDGDKNKILQLLNEFIDQTINVKVIDVNPEEEKLIVSEKATLSEKEEAEIKKFKIGDTICGVASGIVDFGVFVKFPPHGKSEKETDPKDMLEGLVHISELAWQLIENPRDIIKVGEKVKSKIIGIDNNRISLSIRSLKKDPWSDVEKKYQVGTMAKGTVTKLNPFGAFVQLDQNIHGLAHISELNRYFKEKSVESALKVGEDYKFKILSIDPKNHRMGLTPDVAGEKSKDSKASSEPKIKEVKDKKVKKEKKKEAPKKEIEKIKEKKEKPKKKNKKKITEKKTSLPAKDSVKTPKRKK